MSVLDLQNKNKRQDKTTMWLSLNDTMNINQILYQSEISLHFLKKLIITRITLD